MKIEVVYDESQNREYNGEMYYAYIAVDESGGVAYTKTLYTEGVYENQTLYILQDDGTMVPNEQFSYTFSVKDGYVEPHVSLCKDTMKVHYNVDGCTIVLVENWEYGHQDLSIYDSNGDVLVSLSQSKPSGYIIIPSDSTLVVGYADYMLVDGSQKEFDSHDSSTDRFTYNNIPLNAQEIRVGFCQ